LLLRLPVSALYDRPQRSKVGSRGRVHRRTNAGHIGETRACERGSWRRTGGALGVLAFAVVVAAPLHGRMPVPGSDEPAARELDVVELAALAEASTVRIAARGCGTTITGSGFVSGGVLVTNRHLVLDVPEAKVDQPTAPTVASVLRRASDLDLATLAPVGSVPLVAAEHDAARGDEVVFAGHADGGQTIVRRATVHLHTDGEAYGVPGRVMLLDGDSAAGFSGGPVLDARGRLVGVLQGYEPNLRLTLAIPVSAAEAWLQDGPDAGAARGGDPCR